TRAGRRRRRRAQERPERALLFSQEDRWFCVCWFTLYHQGWGRGFYCVHSLQPLPPLLYQPMPSTLSGSHHSKVPGPVTGGVSIACRKLLYSRNCAWPSNASKTQPLPWRRLGPSAESGWLEASLYTEAG